MVPVDQKHIENQIALLEVLLEQTTAEKAYALYESDDYRILVPVREEKR